MINAFNQHLNQNFPFLKNKKLLIAISGGIDSIVLTHLLYRAKYNISLAHCNFLLRGKESNKDERFVIQIGENKQLPTYTKTFNTNEYGAKKGISTQMAARKLRYKWFCKLCEKHQIDYIVTAHHKDDVIETFLINLTRGTGLEGLTGIPEVNNNVVRPLLPFIREEILIYATQNKLQWREDSSNSSIKYIRNKIRHKVIPVLKEVNPSLLNSFQNTLEYLEGSQQIINDRITNITEKHTTKHGKETHYNVNALQNLSNPKAYLFELFKKYGFTEWNDVVNLLSAQTGKYVISDTHRLLKNRDVLILSKISDTTTSENYQITKNTKKIKEPLKLKFETVDIPFDTKNHQNKVFGELILDDENTMSIDYNKIQFPLTIRKWQKGDYFYPIGLHGKKKLSKYFKDEKLSLSEKENTWLLCTKNNDIIWVIGKRLDDRFKVTQKTASIFKIKY